MNPKLLPVHNDIHTTLTSILISFLGLYINICYALISSSQLHMLPISHSLTASPEEFLIYLLTAIGLSPGGSSTVHIYTQTIYRTTQNK